MPGVLSTMPSLMQVPPSIDVDIVDELQTDTVASKEVEDAIIRALTKRRKSMILATQRPSVDAPRV